MKKITKEEVINYCRQHGNWNLVSDYKNAHAPLTIEKDGYLIETTFTLFKSAKQFSVFSSKNKYFKENIQKYIKSKNENVKFINAELTRKSGKARLLITMIDQNGHCFQKTLEHLLNDSYLCCKLCAKKKREQNLYKSRFAYWVDMVQKKGYEILEIPTHLTSNSKIKIEDKTNGYRYVVNINSLKYIKTPYAFSQFANKEFLLYNLIVYKNKNNLFSTPLSLAEKSNSSHIMYNFQCICGNSFCRSINKWMAGNDLCNECGGNQSQYEKHIANVLSCCGIDYIQEFVFPNCKDKNVLPFDFYLIKYNAIIEVDGEQHYMPIAFSGDSNLAQKRFELQKQHDIIKTNYCKNNAIPLLRISYLDFENKTWNICLENFINQLKSNEL